MQHYFSEKQDEKFGDKLTLEEFLDDKYKPLAVEPIWLTGTSCFNVSNNNKKVAFC